MLVNVTLACNQLCFFRSEKLDPAEDFSKDSNLHCQIESRSSHSAGLPQTTRLCAVEKAAFARLRTCQRNCAKTKKRIREQFRAIVTNIVFSVVVVWLTSDCLICFACQWFLTHKGGNTEQTAKRLPVSVPTAVRMLFLTFFSRAARFHAARRGPPSLLLSHASSSDAARRRIEPASVHANHIVRNILKPRLESDACVWRPQRAICLVNASAVFCLRGTRKNVVDLDAACPWPCLSSTCLIRPPPPLQGIPQLAMLILFSPSLRTDKLPRAERDGNAFATTATSSDWQKPVCRQRWNTDLSPQQQRQPFPFGS